MAVSTFNTSPSNSNDNYLPDGTAYSLGNQVTSYPTAVDASTARLSTAGITNGANAPGSNLAGSVLNFAFNNANPGAIDPVEDWRVRISMQPTTAALFYANPGNPMMYPLSQTSGVVFPYTPQITVTHAAKYGMQQLTHSNYAAYFYEGSEVQQITINAEFTVQNIAEGQYLAAVIQFFRSCTKMFFGDQTLAGTPPPMVFLDGYGPAYLPHVPCVVTQFTHTMPQDVDYIDIPVGINLNSVIGNPVNTSNFAARTRMPTSSTLQVALQPIYSRNNIARNFTLQKFASGALIQGGSGTVGGFI